MARKKTRPRAETVRKASKRGAKASKMERAKPSVRAGGSRSRTRFGWLTDQHFRAFGRARGLSKRQIEVMILTCRDIKRSVMATRLHLNVHAVNTHCHRLHKKLGVKDRLEIAEMVEQFARESRRNR